MKAYKCELCDNIATKSSIIGDIYYQHLCMACYDHLISMEGESSGAASYNRQRDLEDNLHEVIQPYEDGQPSKEFIHLYPEKAQQMWSAEEIDRAARS